MTGKVDKPNLTKTAIVLGSGNFKHFCCLEDFISFFFNWFISSSCFHVKRRSYQRDDDTAVGH